MVHKKIVSLLFLLLGISLLYFGMKDIHVITAYLHSIVPITPDSETKIFIIAGTASLIAGFVGIIRDKTIDV